MRIGGESDGEVQEKQARVAAREFRYAGARQRYLTRQLDPSTLDPIPGSDVWSDYLGDSIYGDYTLDSGTATMTQRYVPGEWQTDVQSATTSFFHTNKLGTTRMLSDNLGTAIPDTNRLYTAFGVPVTEPISQMTRYGYAGAWGYQEHDDLSILHLGARYYAPSIGRFLQRDPIGINGGLNVYAYVGNNPLRFVDPLGLTDHRLDEPPGYNEEFLLPFLAPASPLEKKLDDILRGLDDIQGRLDGLDRRLDRIEDRQENPGVSCNLNFTAGYAKKGVGAQFSTIIPLTPKRTSRWWNGLKNWWEDAGSGLGGPAYAQISCFVAGTEVLTEHGLVSVEELAAGDCVVFWDNQACSETTCEVSAIHRGHGTELVHISVKGETITCTPEHPFWVVDHGWVKAGNLVVGDRLIDANGGTITIVAVEHELLRRPVQVYNITVAGKHTFHVGSSCVLVHNKLL